VCYSRLMSATPSFPISRRSLDQTIAELEQHEAELTQELALTEKRLAWLRQGPELFADPADENADTLDREDREAVAQQREYADPNAQVTELVPESVVLQNGTTNTPGTLRQTVLRVFLDTPLRGGREPILKAADIIGALERNGQLPQGDYGESTVRRMLRDMAKRDQLDRPANGKFRLAKGVRDAGGVVLHAARGPGDLQREITDVLYAAATPLTPTELHASIQARGATVNKGSIHNALPRLLELGLVERAGVGAYQLARDHNGTGDEET
jgi:hypothetical protein